MLVCTRVRGQLQKLAHVPAHLAVVPNDQWLHRPERGQLELNRPGARVRQRAAVSRVQLRSALSRSRRAPYLLGVPPPGTGPRA